MSSEVPTMNILVANLGSTSFKYRLYDMTDERQLARGGVERIGSAESRCFVDIAGTRREMTASVPDHAEAVRQCIAQLTDRESGCLREASDVSAIGFKAVHGGRVGGVRRIDDDVLAAMDEMRDVAPAHNPPYVAAMRLLREKLPEIPLVAAFETAFHETIPERLRHYAIPHDLAEGGLVRRWGFHGASHRYIAHRTADLLGDALRVISCHLGGSSSLCALRGRTSVATTMGMSPQSGLPQNNRVGDFDPFALPLLMKQTGKSAGEVLGELAHRGGLLGLSGISGDVRDLQEAAAGGNARARLALDVYVSAVRHFLGAYLVELGGLDVLVFTGGIGENGAEIRRDVCSGLAELGIALDEAKNAAAEADAAIGAEGSSAQIWVIATNEEIIVARQVQELLSA